MTQEENCKISRWTLLKSKLNNLTPEAFKKGIESDPDAVVIDCRKPEEVKMGTLYKALHINYLGADFLEQMEALAPEKHYYVYCQSGRRSTRTCTLFKNGGLENVYNLDGGLNEWVEVFGTAELR